jgi:hypothetical protein
MARVRAKTTHARDAIAGEIARTFVVTLDESPSPSGEVRVSFAFVPSGKWVVEAGAVSVTAGGSADRLSTPITLNVTP